MTTSNTSMLVTLLPLIILGVIGLILIVIGLRRWRLGDEPRCRSCLYNLTGLTSGRCPECGQSIVGPYSIVKGLRKRKPKIACAGFAMIVPLLTIPLNIGYSTLKTSGLFPCLPFSWVLNSAKSDSKQALNEIDRRLNIGSLSQGQLTAFVETAMAKQTLRWPMGQRWIDWLDTLHGTGQLTAEQADCYVSQLAFAELNIRSLVRKGDPLPMDIYGGADLPSNSTYVVSGEACMVTIAGHTCLSMVGEIPFDRAVRSVMPMMVSNIRTNLDPIVLEQLPQGKHDAVLSCNISIFKTQDDLNSGKPPLRTVKANHTAKIEILPENDPDPVRYADNQPAAEAIREKIGVFECFIGPSPRIGFVHCTCHIGPAVSYVWPISLAFDVFVVTSNGEIHVGTITNRNRMLLGKDLTFETRDFEDETVTVILRSSLEVARKSMDSFEIWQGSLVFEDVPVARP